MHHNHLGTKLGENSVGRSWTYLIDLAGAQGEAEIFFMQAGNQFQMALDYIEGFHDIGLDKLIEPKALLEKRGKDESSAVTVKIGQGHARKTKMGNGPAEESGKFLVGSSGRLAPKIKISVLELARQNAHDLSLLAGPTLQYFQ